MRNTICPIPSSRDSQNILKILLSNLHRSRERESRNSDGWVLQDKDDGCSAQRVGYLDRGTGKHQSNEVFDPNGIARTLQSGLEMKNPMKIYEDDN